MTPELTPEEVALARADLLKIGGRREQGGYLGGYLGRGAELHAERGFSEEQNRRERALYAAWRQFRDEERAAAEPVDCCPDAADEPAEVGGESVEDAEATP